VECVFRTPAPARRRKKRTQEEVLQARLSQYENLLKSHGLNPDDAIVAGEDPSVHEASVESEALPETETPDSPAYSRKGPQIGKLYHKRGEFTFLEK